MLSLELCRLLRSCESLTSLQRIHARVLSLGALSLPRESNSICSLLVEAYTTFLQPDSALAVLNSGHNPSISSWNTLIRSQIRSGFPKKAIDFYHLLLRRGFQPDNYTFTFVFKACAASLDSETGHSIHQEIKRRYLTNDLFISTALVDMYCKLGSIWAAREVFDSMPVIDIVTWNAMIAGLSQNGHPSEALELFTRMQLAGQAANSITLFNLFPSIVQLGNIFLCKAVHGFSLRRSILNSISNKLIDAYCKCRNTKIAHKVFDEMTIGKDDVSWGTLISGYVYNRCHTQALDLFDAMKISDLKINQVAVLSALTAAGETGNLSKLSLIHNHAIKKRMDFNLGLNTTLFTMYAKCGDIEKSKSIFKSITEKDLVSWSAMISSCAQNGYPKDAILFFKNMQIRGVKPNIVTLVSVLPACADLSDHRLGKSIHCFALKAEMVLDITIRTSLVSMYAKCGLFRSAHIIFDRFHHKEEVVAFNALISGYVQFDKPLNALQVFDELRLMGIIPDHGTIISVLSAYSLLSLLKESKCLHSLLVKLGFDYDLHVKNSALELYSKCGDIPSSRKIFLETKSFKDVISWNTMINGYIHNGKSKKAILMLRDMRDERIEPNVVTLITILPALASLAMLKDGTALHSHLINRGFGSHVSVGNCLIDMYSKCGRLDCARNVFDEMGNKDTVSWNAMLVGYSIHGLGHEALALFSQMECNSVQADPLTYLAVLSACRHGGLVVEGKMFFDSILNNGKLKPDIEHFACMVDMLGRAGQLNEALRLVNSMPIPPDSSIWGALLGACKMHQNTKLGEIASKQLERLGPRNGAHYVVLSNIYAQNKRWEDARKMRRVMSLARLDKTPGCSW